MPSTFETLPDEILMIIIQYSGDIPTILRTFLGLNHRLTRVLIDKRLHLLTDFLSINRHHASFNDYYSSVVFCEISHQLLSINGTVDEQQLHQCFQLLMSFHMQEQYKWSGNELQLKLAMFNARRQHLTNAEIANLDKEINERFMNLRQYPVNINDLRQIELLVLERGARLECNDSENEPFNLAIAINDLLHADINNMNSVNRQLFHVKNRMFKALIVSNARLLTNRDYFIYNGFPIWYFLFFSVYRAHYYRYSPYVASINMECYKTVIDLVFFAIQCQRLQFNIKDWTQKRLFDILNMIPALELVHRNGIFVENAQWEVLKIITDIDISAGATPWNDDLNEEFPSILGNLINKKRFDIVLFIYRHLEPVKYFFNQPSNCRPIVDKMTRSQLGRQFLSTLMNESPLESWVTGKDLVFTLLQKKERKLLENLLRLSPCLIHQLDEHGNDPLLYTCLKVRGCRHRLVELLIKMKSDLHRKNFNEENFFDTIKLKRNEKLFEKLNLEEIIKINYLQNESLIFRTLS